MNGVERIKLASKSSDISSKYKKKKNKKQLEDLKIYIFLSGTYEKALYISLILESVRNTCTIKKNNRNNYTNARMLN